MRRAGAALLLAAASVVSSAASADEPAGGELVGTVWRWVRLASAETVEVDEPERYTLELAAGGRYAIRADCNRGSGSYSLDGAALRLGPGPMTRAACPPGSLGDRFAGLLSRVASWQRHGSALRLALEDGSGALEFEARPRVSLPGTSWQVRAYNNGRQAVVSVAAGTRLDMIFAEDGNVAGSAGCNRYSATFEVDGDSLRIGPVRATRMACPEPAGVLEQEAAFLAALEMVATWRAEGDRLQLRSADGALAIDLASP